ncbi:MAG: tRNA (N(6)-L-threonylcarbamoyladenosine(37)-C(2))-methylthiotransferase MtaB [Lachnospiraceae bacterium]|nr:tRNA (N(6)-L-threonylcarbamoyladenosine(37)-C(2))-methylthiotransferase MtaB [Lachnospiraceae bacterium]
MVRNLRVAFHNLGCKVNAYETEKMISRFQAAGYTIVDFEEESDIYVVNTCTVTQIADHKSRQLLHRAKEQNPAATVVACGCYVETDREKAAADPRIDLLVGNRDKERIVEIVEDYLGKEGNFTQPEVLGSLRDHTRAYVKIQDGCNQFCSYCIIPFARGRIKSRPAGDILRELSALSEAGIKEAVLTGIHLSSYGLDLSDAAFADRTLMQVIGEAAKVPGIKRIRLGSLEPRIITEEFLSFLSETEKFCPHFHLSLQSGSDTVLKRMNRHYDTAEYFHKTEMIRAFFTHPAITTDIIVGFPGESEEEFEETRAFLEKADLYETHIFRYSRRKGTAADRMSGQLTDRIKRERSKILAQDNARRMKRFSDAYAGKKATVLWEEKKTIGEKAYFTGFTEDYVKMACEAEGCRDLTNRIEEGFCSGERLEDNYMLWTRDEL